MKKAMQEVHDVLENRWKAAHSPVCKTEFCLWDMERYLEDMEQHREPEDVLSEAIALFETWVENGVSATEKEKRIIQNAQEILTVSA